MSHYKKLDDLTRFPPNRAEIAPKRDHQRFQKPTIVLDGALIFLLFRHIMFGWALYEVFGRFFVFLPSALWLCLTLIFIHVGMNLVLYLIITIYKYSNYYYIIILNMNC